MTDVGSSFRSDVCGWHLPLNQRFQFGDLRIEPAYTPVVVDPESAGGAVNAFEIGEGSEA
ncbi:MAG TPA: hypothetical protein VGR29_05645 [Thermomicrobiales bacterium]|nr:hypothetical protein [Thermomicrobiales bacterium]